MITFNSVSKKFPLGTVALNKVSFTIKDNEFVFLTGPSGAGKTTIIKLIPRFITPTSGSIMVNNDEITHKNFHDVDRLRQSMGVVFQDFKILFDYTVAENIALGEKIVGTPDSAIASEISRVLSLVGLEGKKLLFPIQLSAGELQRVALARAIMGNRSVILADEPTGNLDPKTTWEIIKIFQKLQSKKTVIIATHNIDIVNSLKKRVITLEGGALITDERGGTYRL